jgi:heme/copper-type cytochrome/quinol oxidase subunit 3
MRAAGRDVDVSGLPAYAFGHKGLIWWGTVGYMVIEGSILAIGLITYFYLRLRSDVWPPSLPDPSVGYGTANLAVMAVSCVPAQLAKVAAERYDVSKVRLWLVALTLVGVVATVLRVFEFYSLNCRWDSNAYGSVVWFLMGLHTIHVVTDVVDGAVLAALMFAEPPEKKRFIDVSENSLYWYFIVLWWIPYYLTVYWAPRWL